MLCLCKTGSPGQSTEVMQTDRRQAMVNVAVQTEEGGAVGTSLEATRAQARHHGQFLTDARVLRASVRTLMKSHLRMPGTTTAAMELRLDFSSLPLMAWRMLFEQDSFEWHSQRGPTKSTHVGIIRSPRQLNSLLDMGRQIEFGIGSCRLVVPPGTGQVGRSVIGYVPTFQLWHQALSDGTMTSVLTAFLVILDESGEMRTPPNHAFTDEEELEIKTVFMENVRLMEDLEWPLSERFQMHLEEWEVGLMASQA